MNKKQKEVMEEFAKIFKALSSKENLILFYQICQKPTITNKLDIGLSVMPLNRRLNILKEAGLIERIKIKKQGNYIENRIKIKPFQSLINKLDKFKKT